MRLECKQSKLKVIFFILLLLLIAEGSVQINVATTTCKNVETLPQKKRRFLLQIAPGLHLYNIVIAT